MKTWNLDPVLEQIEQIVRKHEIAPGQYARWLWQTPENNRKMGINAYGCADAANILYTLQKLPSAPDTRKAHIDALQGLQNPVTGLFTEETLTPIHTTAHCAGALNLFDAKPLYPYYELEQYKDPVRLGELLSEFNAHKGAGIYAAFANAGQADMAWSDAYFNWLDTRCNPVTGLWCPPAEEGIRPGWWCAGDTFHYLFNHEYARVPFPYPDQLIDSCIRIYREGDLPYHFATCFHFIEVDWVYDLNRASRKTSHRFDEVKSILAEFAERFMLFIESVDWEHDESANDLHLLFGGTCCLAELQQALPGMFRSTLPLRLVLDRRPFI